jgi:hypothetical protein
MLEVVKLPQAKRGFVLLPRRWVVERRFAWLTRFRRQAKDFERLPKTVAGLHFAVLAFIMLARCFTISARHALAREFEDLVSELCAQALREVSIR